MTSTYTITERLHIYKMVKATLNNIVKNNDDMVCLNNYGSINLLDYVKNKKKIGTSSKYGDVYRVTVPVKKQNINISIKLVPLSYKDRINMFDTRYPVWREWKSLDLLSRLVKKQICPNLPILYDKFLCNYCTYENEQLDPSGKMCLLLLSELSDKDLRQWIIDKSKEDITESVRIEEWYNCYFQILVAIYAIQKYYQLAHRDLHWGNILFNNTIKQGYWIYQIDNIKYYLPNAGFVVKLWDFGKSLSITHFKYTPEDIKIIESDDLNDRYSTETSLFGSDIHKISNVHQWINTTYAIKNKEVLPKKIATLLKNFQIYPKENVVTLLKVFMSRYLNNRIGKKVNKECKLNISYKKDISHYNVGEIVEYKGKYALVYSIFNLKINLILKRENILDAKTVNSKEIGKISSDIKPDENVDHFLKEELLGYYKI
jgi:hypothetical protein